MQLIYNFFAIKWLKVSVDNFKELLILINIILRNNQPVIVCRRNYDLLGLQGKGSQASVN